jgi:hypothetical protein
MIHATIFDDLKCKKSIGESFGPGDFLLINTLQEDSGIGYQEWARFRLPGHSAAPR